MRQLVQRPPSRLQKGTYAVEFSIVFLVFFTMLYAFVCYGIVFAMRSSLQNAAEDGARAALRYQVSWTDRKNAAESAVITRLPSWIPVARTDIVADRCQYTSAGGLNCTTSDSDCGRTWEQRCQVRVRATARGLRELLPPLPSFAVPDAIGGQASMLLDGAQS